MRTQIRPNKWLIRLYLLSLVLGLSFAPAIATPAEINYTAYQPIESLIAQAFPDDSEHMIAIANCESGLKQFVNGQPLVSHTNDYGLFQINEASWDKHFQDQNIDYKNSLQDNIKAAQQVYEIQGRSAWVCDRLI